MEDEKKIPQCKKCLIREQADNADLQNAIQRQLEAIPAGEKAQENVYEERLALCRECDMLLAGMCRKCGCYVEIRAAKKKQDCPWGKW